MATMYISPTGSGLRDGSSWENAATIGSLSKLIAKAGPGGEVQLRADMGSYQLRGALDITAGGTAEHDVTIRGVDGNGNDMNAQFVGTRMDEYVVGGAAGSDGFVLLNGANHLNFKNLAFEDFKTAIRGGWDLEDISISNVRAENVQRFFDNYYNGVTRGATISGLLIEDVEVHGFSKGAIRLQYDTNNVVIRNVVADSERQDGDNFAIGVHMTDSVHDVLVQNTIMRNAQDSLGKYWNGDGFATESGVHDIRFENTISTGNTDAGYDLKSTGTVLVGAIAADNKRNYRIWSDDVTIIDSQSLDPHTRGGTGSQAHFQINTGASVTVINSLVANSDPKTIAFDVTLADAHVQLDNVGIYLPPNGRLTYINGANSGVTNVDGSPVVPSLWSQDTAELYRPLDGRAPLEPTTISVSAPLESMGEGASGSTTLSFTVARSGDARGESSVSYHIEGTGAHAADASDFFGRVLPSGTVTFAAGETEKVVSVQIKGDLLVENDETFTFSITDSVNATIANGRADVTILNDDPTASGLTHLSRANAIDVSAATSDTFNGPSHHNSFFVDKAAVTGQDAIKNFGRTDALLTTSKFYDSNNDGIITFGSAGKLSVDGPGGTDSLDFSASRFSGIRYLGMTDDALHVYAQSAGRPARVVEGTLGDDTLTADAGDAAINRFFFDTALDIDLGDDIINNFGTHDMIVTTTRLADEGGKVLLGADGKLALPGGTGGAEDGYFAGEGGTVQITGVTELEYDGSVLRNGSLFHIYSLSGSTIGLPDF